MGEIVEYSDKAKGVVRIRHYMASRFEFVYPHCPSQFGVQRNHSLPNLYHNSINFYLIDRI